MKIFITGISSGIGYGLAREYLINGHSVYGISRRDHAKLKKFEHFNFLSQDITQFGEIRQNLRKFLENLRKLDLVVLNAGTLPPINDLKDTSLQTLKDIMNVNVWANKVIIDSLFTLMEDISQVVAISSGAAVSGARGWNGYALSKATLNMLIKLYAKEFPNTHFSAIAPGIIDTSMQEYISGLPEDERFSVVQRLKSMRGTPDMPGPATAAPRLIKAFKKILQIESGKFVDIREL